MSRLITLRAQLLVLVLGALVVAQAVSVALFIDERRQAVGTTAVREAAGRMTALAAVLAEAPAAATQDAVLRAARSRGMRFSVDPTPATAAPGAEPPGPFLSGWLERSVDARDGRFALATLPRDQTGRRRVVLSLPLDAGGWLNGVVGLRRPPLQWAWPAVLSLALTASLLTATIWWAVRGIARPIDRLALSADALGRGETPDPLPLSGPAELRHVAASFNAMAGRLTRLLADRARMLAAIGHDLRSPVTAMRLRLAMLEDEEAAARLGVSLDEIHTLVEAALALARGGGADQPRTAVNLATLLDEIAGALRETGADSTLTVEAPATVHGAPDALRRAVRNVAENAVRYGGVARLTLARRDTDALIVVEDDGPGIPADERAHVFDPFVRLEGSRSRDTGGAGLGLAIARAAIDGHGGTIKIADAVQGTRVEITLPVMV